jgi:GNAT superfamily N-acetyltransferase
MAVASKHDYRVREATVADEPAIDRLLRAVDLIHATVAPRFFAQTPVSRADSVLEDATENPFESLWIAEDASGKTVGLCHVQLYDTPQLPGMHRARRAHVETMVVDEGMRRKGCGRALLDAASRWAKDHGAEQMLLTVWAKNATATEFYRALGFEDVNTVLGKAL